MSPLGRTPLAYRRRASPLHAASGPVAAAYGVALATAALLTEHPLVLAALALAVLGAAAAAGVARPISRVALISLPIMLLSVVAVNLLASRQGLTVFARLGEWGPLGQVDLTVEALVFGLVFTLRLLIVALACMLVVCTADPDELLLAFRRFSPRSALTLSLATRLIPVLGQDARRLAEAQRCRPDGGARGTTAKLVLVRATVSGALERALDVAAVLEMRGYGSTPRTARPRRLGGAGARRLPRIDLRRRSRHDLGFALAACAVLALSIAAAIGGLAPFSAYPLVSFKVDPGVLALCVLLSALALAPFADRRGIEP
jgi:energy-coupling factor transport system permease protein